MSNWLLATVEYNPFACLIFQVLLDIHDFVIERFISEEEKYWIRCILWIPIAWFHVTFNLFSFTWDKKHWQNSKQSQISYTYYGQYALFMPFYTIWIGTNFICKHQMTLVVIFNGSSFKAELAFYTLSEAIAWAYDYCPHFLNDYWKVSWKIHGK